jgi:hypothetical protein
MDLSVIFLLLYQFSQLYGSMVTEDPVSDFTSSSEPSKINTHFIAAIYICICSDCRALSECRFDAHLRAECVLQFQTSSSGVMSAVVNLNTCTSPLGIPVYVMVREITFIISSVSLT